MSVYFTKGKGWRYDFIHKRVRRTGAWYKTKSDARQAESERKEEMQNPKQEKQTPTAMGFLDLVNRRLDHVKAYNSASYYKDHVYMARRWAKEWGNRGAEEISADEIQAFVRKPWVFWHRHWDRKKKEWVEGPYKERKTVMKSLCKRAGVRYFRYHPLRHLGASMLDRANVNIGSIQRILGHENRSTTEIYLHSIGEAEREAMRIFEWVSENSHTESHTETKKEVGRNG